MIYESFKSYNGILNEGFTLFYYRKQFASCKGGFIDSKFIIHSYISIYDRLAYSCPVAIR